jgi:alkylation response protein AidB-like acyl-CoA dehydrogenase
MSERHAVGTGATDPTADPIARLRGLIQWSGRSEDPVVRQQMAQVVVIGEILRYLNMGKAEALAAGRPLGPEGSLAKVLGARHTAMIGGLAGELLGPAITADSGEWGTFAWSQWVIGTPHRRIAGGTDEIQHNILAERVLGLPRDPAGRG